MEKNGSPDGLDADFAVQKEARPLRLVVMNLLPSVPISTIDLSCMHFKLNSSVVPAEGNTACFKNTF